MATLIEKPVALTAAACEPLLAAATQPVVTAVGYMNRYRPGVTRLREALADAPPLGISARWFCGRYRVPWWSDPDRSGGPINEQFTHLVDLCRYLAGEITVIQALAPVGDGPPESAAVSLAFASGTVGTLIYSCRSVEKHIGLQVFTSSRAYALEGWDFLDGPPPAEPPDKNAVFLEETRAFLEAVSAGGDGIRSDLRDAARTQRVVDAVLRSISSGAAVEL